MIDANKDKECERNSLAIKLLIKNCGGGILEHLCNMKDFSGLKIKPDGIEKNES